MSGIGSFASPAQFALATSTGQFLAARIPADLQDGVFAPRNPFETDAYVRAQHAGGAQAWLLRHRSASREVWCLGFERRGNIDSALEIHSLPREQDEPEFWSSLISFCRSRKIQVLNVNTFASPSVKVPLLANEVFRRSRREWVLDICQTDQAYPLSENHARNIRRAEKSGCLVLHIKSSDGQDAHARLLEAPNQRSHHSNRNWKWLIDSGAGELWQTVVNGDPVSSLLLLRSSDMAYYHSAGTSPEGRTRGASHLLVHTVARELKAQGVKVFNLGGDNGDDSGLARFKSGFGATPVELEAASFFVGNPIRRRITQALNWIARR